MQIGSLEKYLNVAIPIIRNNDGNVLIVKRKDPIYSADGVFHWHFPGVVLDVENDYTPLIDFVSRETGYEIQPGKIISERNNHPLGHRNIYVECALVSEDPQDEDRHPQMMEECIWANPMELDKYFTSNLDHGVANFLGIRI